MRQPTEDFTPGFGGLFTMQFENVEVASVFFNALNVHKGPSLGANITLVQPYVLSATVSSIAPPSTTRLFASAAF